MSLTGVFTAKNISSQWRYS